MATAAQWVSAVLDDAAEADLLPVVCTGDAAPALFAHLEETGALPERDRLLPVAGSPGATPGAVALLAAQAAADQLLVGEALDALVPAYLRGSDAIGRCTPLDTMACGVARTRARRGNVWRSMVNTEL